MPLFEHGQARIYYEEHGAGFPLLLIAPGGMNSTVDWWERAAFNPLRTYVHDFRLVAMDQRNAGRSRGPLVLDDPWGSFVDDQVALLDHLGIDRFHVMGCCIGCSHALRLMTRVPGRVTAAVLEQPIGIVDDNRELFDAAWREWGARLVESEGFDPEAVEAFGQRMWRDDFVVSVSRDVVRACPTPMLVLPGIDRFHPTAIGREVAQLAPCAEVMEPWKDTPELIQQAVDRIRRFLRDHTPST
ncbi:MAG TPA: alpha/beta hydrolase [Candidatus Dormibacteraeota bacterium]|nr:alpha/beta hydrolase [Candidatus Dormibacteraeota bacterium]